MPDTLTGEVANLMNLLDDPANNIVAHLSKNAISVFKDSALLSDFTESDFAGYAPVRVVDCIPFESDDGIYAQAISQPLVFQANGIAAPQPISAVYVTISKDGAAPTLLLVDIFSSPLLIHQDGQTFMYELNFEAIDDEELSD